MKKKDTIESRLRQLEERKVQTTKPDDALTYELKHMDFTRLAAALMACTGVAPEEAEKIKGFAEQSIKNPTAPIADEFLSLSFVKAYVEKRRG